MWGGGCFYIIFVIIIIIIHSLKIPVFCLSTQLDITVSLLIVVLVICNMVNLDFSSILNGLICVIAEFCTASRVSGACISK